MVGNQLTLMIILIIIMIVSKTIAIIIELSYFPLVSLLYFFIYSSNIQYIHCKHYKLYMFGYTHSTFRIPHV